MSLLHNILHSCCPDLSELKLPVRRSSRQKTTIEINSLQPSQLLNRPFPSLLNSPEIQQFLKKFKFKISMSMIKII